MRVLFVIGQLGRGGAEKHLSLILPLLKQRGIEPAVFISYRGGALEPIFEKNSIPLFGPARLRGVGLRQIDRIRAYLATLDAFAPDVVHHFLPESYAFAGMASRLSSRRFRSVMSRRSLDSYKKGRPLLALIERHLHPKMAALVGNSQAVVEQLNQECPGHPRILLNYNGVAIPSPATAEERQRARAALGISDGDLVGCIVANLIPYKGHLDLIDALAIAEPKPTTPLRILAVGGGGDYQSVLQRHAEERGVAGAIRWLGQLDDICPILAASDFGLLTSHQEGFSNSLLEGMAAGLPMIATAVGGNPEALTDGCGLLVPPRDPPALAAALTTLAADERLRLDLGAAARQRALEHFSLESCTTRYEELYRALATA